MAHSSASRSLLALAGSFKKLKVTDPVTQCLAPRLSRHYAVQTQLPTTDIAESVDTQLDPLSVPGMTTSATSTEMYTLDHPVLATRYTWPAIEPAGYALYDPKYMDAPLRRDLLHRAVIYEADRLRQGTASTKWRSEVHGSNRKIHAQKGSGRARAGDKKSPIRRGGGKAFGPKPRDFSTELPAKVYRQAIRIALSHRLRQNELIILNDKITLPEANTARFLNNLFEANLWGQGYGRSLLVTETPEEADPRLFETMETVGEHAELRDLEDVDVRDLLKGGRVVIERSALIKLLFKTENYMLHRLKQPSKIVEYL